MVFQIILFVINICLMQKLTRLLFLFSIFGASSVKAAVSEEFVNTLLQRINLIYTPIAVANGGGLFLFNDWQYTQPVCMASRFGKDFVINVYGGLARKETTTGDSLSAVICHELGHHFGGSPKKTNPNVKWSSSEGQADYYSTLDCLPKLFAQDNNIEIIKGLNPNPFVIEQCQKTFPESNERTAICIRTLSAVEIVTNQYLETTGPFGYKLNFETPDLSSVETTNYDLYPGTQCRMDTLFNGAVGKVRPTCWFKNE